MSEKTEDFVTYIMDLLTAMHPAFPREKKLELETRIRNEWGGGEIYIPKKRITAANKQKAIEQYIGGKPLKDILRENGMSRRSLYRAIKK